MALRRKKLKEMASEQHLDMISSLSDKAIDKILMCLPIREAVATSRLSTTWRYRWMTIPELKFDDPGSTGCTQNIDKWVNFINKVLLLHEGDITRFEIRNFVDSTSRNVDSWLLFLSRKGLTKLFIEFKSLSSYVCHSSLFSCQALIDLELHNCGLKVPSQTKFKGFKNLTTLVLEDVTADKETVEFLVNTSPLLVTLSIEMTKSNLSCLNISAPNLTSCTIDVKCEYITFIGTPKLIFINISTWGNENGLRCKLDRNLDKLLQLQEATISYPCIECLSVNNFLDRLPITYQHLRHISLDIYFEDPKQILSVFWLFRSSPVLKSIFIFSCVCEDARHEDLCLEEFYEILDKDEAILPSLEEFEIQEFDGSENELKLIEFVLMKAYLLQTMTIEWDTKTVKDIERENKALVKLVQFQRTSSRVEINLS